MCWATAQKIKVTKKHLFFIHGKYAISTNQIYSDILI